MAARTDVLVVGAGVSGLTTGVCLAEQGLRVRIRTARGPGRSTSAAAGAIWDPFYAEHPKTPVWSVHSYKVFTDLNGVAGVRMTEGVEASRDAAEPPDRAWQLPEYRECKPAELPAKFTCGWRYTAPIIDMSRYLPYLLERFRRAGGKLEYGRLRRLDDGFATAPVVVNCAGAAARELVPDRGVIPRRGQLVLVRNPGFTDFFIEESRDQAEMMYLLPQGSVLVLGGSATTATPGTADRRTERQVAKGIRERCIEVFPELAKVPVLGRRVGIRPARHQVRLDVERRGRRHIVHNYGHAGAGVSLSWGCAADVTELVQDLVD
jgi:D-amino-acid oxidase